MNSQISNILRELLTFVSVSPRIFYNNISVSKKLAIQIKFLEESRTSCKSFWEIFRISEKHWLETLQNLKWLSTVKSKENIIKIKKPEAFHIQASIQGKKQALKSMQQFL
jgi:hypothetical protein